MKKIVFIAVFQSIIAMIGCKNKESKHSHDAITDKDIYTCPMHPEIVREEPGKCPICGMDLVKKETEGDKSDIVSLETLLGPTNEFVVSSIPVTTIEKSEEQIEIESLGNIGYDTRQVGNISSRVAGRIEKLYVRYRYQKISKGQHILDIYSPELMTAQQNLLFLLKNDSANATFIAASKEKLLLLGMNNRQLQQVIQSGQPAMSVAVYSAYSGHIHESSKNAGSMNTNEGSMTDIALITAELSLKEGMYVQKGQSIFTVFNPGRAWAILNIYGDHHGLIKTGNAVRLVPETAPGKDFRAHIDFIEPFYRKENKTITARVYFDNSELKIPIGSQVRATIFGNARDAYWLPKNAIVSLGLGNIVFKKTSGGFVAKKVKTGVTHKDHIQLLDGLTETDSVAINAQYLMDSESFIKIKN